MSTQIAGLAMIAGSSQVLNTCALCEPCPTPVHNNHLYEGGRRIDIIIILTLLRATAQYCAAVAIKKPLFI